MNKLATIPYGSRLYGTSDENSDWDWKYIVLPDIGDVLTGKQIKNQFFCTSSDQVKNTSDDTDTELVPVQTFCKDFYAGQTYAIELAFAIRQHTRIDGLEIHDQRIVTIAHELTEDFLTSNINAMVGYAYHQAQLYSEKGNRLGKLMEFRDMLVQVCKSADGTIGLDSKLQILIDMFEGDPAMCGIIPDKMLYITEVESSNGMEKCFSVLEKKYPGNITMDEAILRANKTISKYGNRANEARINEGKDWKAISHAVRITNEALSVLNTEYVTLPLPELQVAQLLAIKYGMVPWEEVQTLLVSNIDKITQDQLTSNLPVANPALAEKFAAWLKSKMLDLYGVTK